MSGDNTFVVVANRLPVDISVAADGTRTFSPSPGGLVTALSPVLERQQGCWVGWPGTVEEVPEPFYTDGGVLLHPVALNAHDFEAFYEGFSNATLWPLYHDLIVPPIYDREWWVSYREVNLKFAHEVAEVAAEGAIVWVQDYQLQLVPGILRQIRPDLTIGFFLHIPFPSPDLFRQLPWREEIVRGLLGADLLGFHLVSSATNFLDLTREVAGGIGSHTGQPDELEVSGQASVREVTAHITTNDNREVGVASFPISIDVDEVLGLLPTPEKVAEVRHDLGDPQTLILGVDRLDYTKGILQRLLAFEELLEAEALDASNTVLVQVATPSRERIDHYKRTRSQVEEAVGRINGRFGSLGKPVVHYHHQSLSKKALLELYSAADIMLVTPFKDGMNLVAKEYVACHGDGSGALVLSEFAGAAHELSEAFLCNPFDMESIKRQLSNAATMLQADPETAARRMNALHEQVIEHDVNLWASSFLGCLHDIHAETKH
ncbi:alpha,alpha-trehalose-phosphate synthase (UDP-forming) [Corynebacterium vitaeruminis]|uniref:alpha,alpha-trehalose-phosphate synthase (ADP-forming) n=1 Tax=Corynebacterium vitaeruminis DSM 20294 TaxID=1224164 RepID=W5Y2Y9_9CORY|nr:trehalose-6-phosphate synthase [Corynebacterium vitaeruminis]AHI23587.1 alpha,alpha-trehalose-phosphate synthase [Corynebacterium vitaeruminis DSM 20294]